ncbi:hypothetical protein PINS_up007679 [Pythium insidiosum]|nr:hypothetical protein PINS_up007679 [Pythium insidiosum]
MHAQIWCHVGWCITSQRHVAEYLRAKQAPPAMVETIARLNATRCYRPSGAASDHEVAGAAERVVGNLVKVLIALQPETAASLSQRQHLRVFVDALRELPDGLARKNVAILLAKLCQTGGEPVKQKVRELRGIEIMLSVSKSLQSEPATTDKLAARVSKAQAF